MNLNKTKFLSQSDIQIKIDNCDIEKVNEYIYLGHTITLGNENQAKELTRRIKLSWAAVGNLGHILKTKIFQLT